MRFRPADAGRPGLPSGDPSPLGWSLLRAASEGPLILNGMADFETVLAVLHLSQAGYLELALSGDCTTPSYWCITARGRGLIKRAGRGAQLARQSPSPAPVHRLTPPPG